MRLPSLPHIDTFSFLLGFASAMFIVWLLYTFRHQLAQARGMLSARFERVREQMTSGTEIRLREDTLRYAQTAHLAGNLFALDEVLITPRLLIPDPPIDPSAKTDEEDITAIIPVLPDWPDLAATFHARNATLEAVLAGEGNVVLLAGPGMGKTTVLAHLATRATQGDETLFPPGPTVLFVHAGDLGLPRGEKDDIL